MGIMPRTFKRKASYCNCCGPENMDTLKVRQLSQHRRHQAPKGTSARSLLSGTLSFAGTGSKCQTCTDALSRSTSACGLLLAQPKPSISLPHQ